MNRWIIAVTVIVFAAVSSALADNTSQAVSSIEQTQLTPEQTKKILEQCDGMGRDKIIHPENIDGKIGGFPEKLCESRFITAINEEVIAKLDEKSAQLDEKSAQLDEKSAQLDEKSAQLDEDIAKLKKINQLLKANGEIKK